MTRDKAYVLGVLCGDGYVQKSCIRLDVVDLDFIETFRDAVFRVYGHKGSIIKNPPRTWQIEGRCGMAKPVFSFHAYGKTLMEDILSFDRGRSFRSDVWLVPIEIRESTDEGCITRFLQGVCDSEGCVKTSERKRSDLCIEIAFGKNKEALLECKDLLKRVGIASVSSRTRTSLTLVIYGVRNVSLFMAKIGFNLRRKSAKLEERLAQVRALCKRGVSSETFYTILRGLLRGKNPYQLEKECGLPFGTIYHWNRGDSFPRRVKWDMLCKVFPPDFERLRSHFAFLERSFRKCRARDSPLRSAPTGPYHNSSF